jgi:signal transduction histidine kinase
VSNLNEPENVYERPFKKLFQVYDGVRTPTGRPVLFEAYLRASSVAKDSNRTLISLAPAMVAGLALLFLAQIPLAWTMAKRIERGQEEEQRLLRRAITAGDIERRHIAADLHDGAVQSLAGTALSLTAAADRATRAGIHDVAADVTRAASELRQGIRELRTLIVAVAPPRLHDEGLAAALADLVSPLRARGVEVAVAVDHDLGCDAEHETLLYRAAQESVRNILRHARPKRVGVRAQRLKRAVRLEVVDDGVGFDLDRLAGQRSSGHVGLQLLGELAHDAGGHLDVASAPDVGTTITLDIPVGK